MIRIAAETKGSVMGSRERKRRETFEEMAGWVPPEHIRRERERARQLRSTQWWKRQVAKGICHYCGRRVPPSELTMDHVVPIVRGGRSTRGNCVPCCPDCNAKKKSMVPVEWEEYLKSLRGQGVKG
jgi:5-methylcytosine-specific restriction endonuclease McrA